MDLAKSETARLRRKPRTGNEYSWPLYLDCGTEFCNAARRDHQISLLRFGLALDDLADRAYRIDDGRSGWI